MTRRRTLLFPDPSTTPSLDAMQPQQLRASEILSNGFRLSWPPLLTADSGYYVLELVPSDKLSATRRQQLPGNATSWIWTDLNPDTDYEVALLPESNVHPLRPQYVRVRTLQGEAGGSHGRTGWHARGALPINHPLPPQRNSGRNASSSRIPDPAASV